MPAMRSSRCARVPAVGCASRYARTALTAARSIAPARLALAAGSGQGVGHGRGGSGACELVQRLVHVAQERGQPLRLRRRDLHRIGDKRQRPPGERLLHEGRGDVQDAVSEPGIGARPAVVGLVRVQEVELSRQTAPVGAAIAEPLHACRRDPDRVGVVPVRLERAAAEERLDALDPLGARADPDRVPARAARSFKTAFLDGR